MDYAIAKSIFIVFQWKHFKIKQAQQTNNVIYYLMQNNLIRLFP